MSHGGAQKGTQLGLEKRRLIQADANCAPAEEWIHLIRERQVGGRLIPTNIERTDNDRATGHHLKYLAIDAILLFLTGRLRIFEIQEFGTEQADALSTICHG